MIPFKMPWDYIYSRPNEAEFDVKSFIVLKSIIVTATVMNCFNNNFMRLQQSKGPMNVCHVCCGHGSTLHSHLKAGVVSSGYTHIWALSDRGQTIIRYLLMLLHKNSANIMIINGCSLL